MLRLNGLSLAIAQALGYSGTVPSFYLNLSNATNATISDGVGVATVTGGGGGGTDAAITPSITTNRTAASNTGVAPFAVQFNSKATTAATYTSKPLYELYHAWNFDDASSGVHGYGTKAGSASRNTAYGHTAAHVFETPGTYTVTYQAWNPGTLTYNTATTTITVTDPDTVFSGANTICIANGTLPVVGVNGVPTGATCVNTSSWATVCSYMTAGKRVLLKRGDTWTTAASVNITAAGPGIIGAFGSGADPVITINVNSAALTFTNASDWRVMDLEITANNGGSDVANNNRWAIRAVTSNFMTMLRVHSHAVYETLSTSYCNDLMQAQCNGHDILSTASGYVVYMEYSERVSILGSRYSQGSASHTFRAQAVVDGVYSHSDFEYPGSTRHAFTLRSWSTIRDSQYVVFSDNNVIGNATSGWLLYFTQANDAIAESIRDVLVERNYVYAPVGSSESIHSKVASDFWCRNNIIKETKYWAIGISYTSSSGAPTPASSYIYNNTIWKHDIAATASFTAFDLGANTTGTVIYNNLIYAPSTTSADALINVHASLTGADYTLSNNSTSAQIKGTKPWAAVTPAVFADYVPNSYGVDGGTALDIYDDFFGTPLAGTPDIGAIQA